jgi:HD-GYP domain
VEGQGYPNKLKGRQIGEFAQIIGVVDIFDALVSPRGYRRRFFPHEAVRELMVAERTAFPREIVKALVEQLSAYPLGTSVRLTTGEVGSVMCINTRYPLRPVVWIEGDAACGQEGRQLDLSLTPLVSIIETLEPPDVARVSFPVDETSAKTPDLSPRPPINLRRSWKVWMLSPVRFKVPSNPGPLWRKAGLRHCRENIDGEIGPLHRILRMPVLKRK